MIDNIYQVHNDSREAINANVVGGITKDDKGQFTSAIIIKIEKKVTRLLAEIFNDTKHTYRP